MWEIENRRQLQGAQPAEEKAEIHSVEVNKHGLDQTQIVFDRLGQPAFVKPQHGYQAMTTLTQRILYGFCIVILVVLGVATLLVSKTHQVRLQKQYGLLLEAIDNVSVQLDKLDSGYEGITTQTNLAKNRLAQLIRIHRENLLVCAIFAQSRKKSSSDKKRNGNGHVSP